MLLRAPSRSKKISQNQQLAAADQQLIRQCPTGELFIFRLVNEDSLNFRRRIRRRKHLNIHPQQLLVARSHCSRTLHNGTHVTSNGFPGRPIRRATQQVTPDTFSKQRRCLRIAQPGGQTFICRCHRAAGVADQRSQDLALTPRQCQKHIRPGHRYDPIDRLLA